MIYGNATTEQKGDCSILDAVFEIKYQDVGLLTSLMVHNLLLPLLMMD